MYGTKDKIKCKKGGGAGGGRGDEGRSGRVNDCKREGSVANFVSVNIRSCTYILVFRQLERELEEELEEELGRELKGELEEVEP